jgi:S1-C subfamily serine protease
MDDVALKTLSELNQLGFIDLYGTGMTDESAAVLAQALPAVTVDRRNGAMLGVKSIPGGGCTINEVVPDSGASAADLRINDEILSIDGHPLQRFEDLTAIVGAMNAGDKISIDVKRDNQVINKQVTLGKWPSIWPN